MHQAESSSSSFGLWTGLSLPAALHPVSRRRSCLPLRTDQCFCPMRTFTPFVGAYFQAHFPRPFGPNRPRYSCLFHDAFEICKIVSRDFGERCRLDARSQPHRNLGRPIGERLEQNDATWKIVRDCLPRNSSLRNTEHDLQNGPVFFAAYRRSEREMGFVDFLNISQRRHESGQFFEARAVGVNVRHRSVQDDRIDLALRIE